MSWKKAVVVSRAALPPERYIETNWKSVAVCDDGSEVAFGPSNLCRDRTFALNTDVGATVWICGGAVTVHEPKGNK